MNVVVRETEPSCFAHFILPVCFIMKGECMMIMDDNIVLYDREAAVEYARTYALVYNKDYPNFDSGTPNSGDCMNFVSQCIHAGGMPQKEYGYLWYCNKKKHSSSWSGVDSFRNYLKKSFGNPRILFDVYETPEKLEKGDIVFTCAYNKNNKPGDINRNPSHIVILSKDYSEKNEMIVCGHTKNQKDEFRDCNDLTSIYIHIIGFAYTYFDSDWKDDTDKATAQADFGKVVLKKGITGYKSEIKNLQVRLNYLGYNAGTADGIYGTKTVSAVTAFQKDQKARFGLAADGKAGEATKEALRYPKEFLQGTT